MRSPHGRACVRPHLRSDTLTVAILFLGACTSDVTEMPVPTGPFDYATTFSELPERQWNEVVLDVGGCARGGPYSFWVYPADPAKLMIQFSGGGACWSQITCAAGTFDPTIDDDREQFTSIRPPGIRNHTNPRNPFADWTHVFLPYCTGDVYIGTKDTTYGSDTLYHLGGTNTRAVVDWLAQSNIPAERLLVGGCSAGGYGAAVWSPTIFDLYPDARKTEYSDAAAGVVSDTFTIATFATWTDTLPLPDWVSSTATSVPGFLADVYASTAARYPDLALMHYSPNEDAQQTLFYTLTGGGEEAFDVRLLENLRMYRAGVPHAYAYISEGFDHCVTDDSIYYAQRVNDIFFRDWLSGTEDRTIQEDVLCDGCGPL